MPLSNGSQAQIPKFLATTCAALESEKNLETEGLFRRNGSLQKQKLMQELLEKGGSLDRSHHAIDIANLLKNFFRSLPEPLIPSGTIQEGLLRCLFHFSSYQEKCEAVLMLILLLPPISVNTLAYFLQFLEKLVKKSSSNLMSVENIVKVLTPTLMPVPHNAPQKRLFSHFKVLELLIENANLIGVVPERLCIFKKSVLIAPNTEERKKKNRRSGSMNRVFTGIHNGFNGLRKIVGAIGSSSESLDRSEEISQDPSAMTPKLIKSSKKRPLDRLDLSTKKK